MNWIPCAHSLPAESKTVLVFLPHTQDDNPLSFGCRHDGNLVYTAFRFLGRWVFDQTSEQIHNDNLVSHWMDLPNEPSSKTSRERC